MRQIFFYLIALQISIASGINWSAPVLLFSSEDDSGITPKIAVHPTEQTATAAWIASGSGTIIYGAAFGSGSWGTPVAISTSANVQASLNLGVNGAGTYVMACDLLDDPELQLAAAYNAGGSWSPTAAINNFGAVDGLIPLNLATQADGTSIITWQGSDGGFYGISYSSGVAGDPYLISEQGFIVTDSITYNDRAIFATAEAVYATPITPSPTNTLLLPRMARPSSLCLDSASGKSVFAFQDQKSNFFLSALANEAAFTYAIIATPNTPIINAKVAVNPNDGHAVAIWQLNTGQIQAAYFDGFQWGNQTTLSTNGASPSIAFNPATNHATALWADLTSNAIFSALFQGYSWSAPVSLSAQGAVVSDPHIRINTQGNAFAVWARQLTSDSQAIIEAAIGQ